MANLIVVLASTDLNRLARQIRGFIRQDGSLVLLALGSGSVFVAVTAIGVARFQLAPDYLDVVFVTELCDRDEEGHRRSALRVYAHRPVRKFRRLRDLPLAT
jgi:stage V sporulation protein SpoVS